MLAGLTWLLACQLVGELVVRLTDVPVPGPVVGMAVLFVAMEVRRRRGAHTDRAPVTRAADALLRHLQLFFVPAGVGVGAYATTIRDDAAPIAVGLVGSWLLALALVGWVTQLLLTRPGRVGEGR
jgi:holin-like protein